MKDVGKRSSIVQVIVTGMLKVAIGTNQGADVVEAIDFEVLSGLWLMYSTYAIMVDLAFGDKAWIWSRFSVSCVDPTECDISTQCIGALYRIRRMMEKAKGGQQIARSLPFRSGRPY